MPAGEQTMRAFAIAERIAKQAPMGVVGTLLNARIAQEQGMDAAREHLAGLMPTIMNSEDAKEGVMSFIERREATFTGR